MPPAILQACAVLLLGAPLWAAPQSPPVNLALGRPYASNCASLPGWNGLLDGEKDSDSAPGCFATANEGGFPRYVVIDLGSECTISKVVVYNSGNGNTRTVSLSSSLDGVGYKKLRDPDFIFADRDAIALSVGFQPRQARYVRATFVDTWKRGLGGDNCLFLREIEVFGSRGAAGDEDPFAFSAGQAPLVTNRAAGIFRRYCLEAPGEMKITVLGDYFVAGSEEDAHWVRQAAEELARLYPGKKMMATAVGGSEGAISYAVDWARDHRGALAPDIVIVAYGAQAASVGADLGEFRSKYETLIGDLADNTQALVIAVTPPPFLQNPGLAMSSRTKGRSTRPYAWAVEQVALTRGLLLVRSAAVLAKTPGDKTPLYADNMHLSAEGQRAVGLALADLLH
jgi:lysophospholipase L1-like esterase